MEPCRILNRLPVIEYFALFFSILLDLPTLNKPFAKTKQTHEIPTDTIGEKIKVSLKSIIFIKLHCFVTKIKFKICIVGFLLQHSKNAIPALSVTVCDVTLHNKLL